MQEFDPTNPITLCSGRFAPDKNGFNVVWANSTSARAIITSNPDEIALDLGRLYVSEQVFFTHPCRMTTNEHYCTDILRPPIRQSHAGKSEVTKHEYFKDSINNAYCLTNYIFSEKRRHGYGEYSGSRIILLR